MPTLPGPQTPQAVLLIAFGGPTQPDEVAPFLANVTRGRPIPPERLELVAHHYDLIGGRSPLNDLTFRQARALQAVLVAAGQPLPVYVGMRNWHPYLHETLAELRAAGIERALGIILSPQQNEAGWGRYVQDVAAARAQLGSSAPHVDFAPEWHVHPRFIEAMRCRLTAALAGVPMAQRSQTPLLFTAHSIPVSMARNSPYEQQLNEAAGLIAASAGHARWQLVYQSRSGNPRDPWLEPDVCEATRNLAAQGARGVVVAPLGFVCDHVEVLYDLDIEAQQVARDLGLDWWRADAVNDHPAFIQMLAELVFGALANPGGGRSRES